MYQDNQVGEREVDEGEDGEGGGRVPVLKMHRWA